ncbi:tetratricopeptide repeat protein [Phytomonospora endophytica]|uniref:Tetratricopeptide (TPR) repeat protein n=1 Tax=Phytomonospora endophytica TaxID=714109 RepID=A0A841G517_9ACTN|nr:tetratricopeptide repeat protein [Phytomonospora endophytica]MBB6039849.1 tetratricopeptide (TPR) repeat protein [Phytomonospora endophytica]GIG70295.1 hypothetical protein Pen01_65900 [Phytomonospora endophytica]
MPDNWLQRFAARVVEVKAVRDGGKRTSAGYLAADGLVLTAGHGLPFGDRYSVRPAGGGSWSPAEAAWRGGGDLDAALLRVAPGVLEPPMTGVRWGRVEGRDPVAGRALGFPRASADGAVHDTEQVAVAIHPDASARSGWMKLDVRGPSPAQAEGWQGLSGAAILDNHDRLIGLVARAPAAWGTDRLHAVSVAALLTDPEFATLVGVSPEHVETIGDECELVTPVPRGPIEPDEDDPVSWPLKAAHQLVGFVEEGHAEALTDLTDWCLSPRPHAVRLVTGPAGAGKTRLVLELCRRLRFEHDAWWHAGTTTDDETGPWERFDPRRDTLLVFDYADDPKWTEAFRALFTRVRALSRGRRLAARVRILLVARHRGEWLDRLDRDVEGALEAALDKEAELALDRITFTGEVRRAHLAKAFDAFASRPALTDGADPLRPDVDDDQYDRPLLVHIAALLGAKGIGVPAPGSARIRERLLRQILDRERKRWSALPAAHDAHRQQAVCVTTLTAPTVVEARELLRSVPVWRERAEDARDDAARRLHELYPGVERRRIAPIEPDLIAEYLVATTDELPDILTGLQSSDDPVHHARTLRLMTLAADNHPEIGDLYRERLATGLGRLLELEGEAPRELPQLLAECLPQLVNAAAERSGADDHTATNQLTAALNSCPPSDELGETATALTEWNMGQYLPFTALDTALHRHSLSWLEGDSSNLPLMAWTSSGLATLLGVAGRDGEALGHIQRAVEIQENLGPGAELARYLGELAYALNRLGRDDEGVQASTRSTEIHRGLARAEPGDHDVNLAMSLNVLGIGLHSLGRREEGLTAMRESLDILTRLSGAGPAGSTAELAATLTNLAVLLGGPEGVEALYQALDIYEELLEEAPDEILSKIASTVIILADCLAETDSAKTLWLNAKAVKVYEHLSEASPEVFAPHLATSLTTLAERLLVAERFDEGQASARRGAEIYKPLFEAEDGERFAGPYTRVLTTLAKAHYFLAEWTETVDPVVTVLQVADGVASDFTDECFGVLFNAHTADPAAVEAEYTNLLGRPWPAEYPSPDA